MIMTFQVKCLQAELGSSSGLPVMCYSLQQGRHQTTKCLAAGLGQLHLPGRLPAKPIWGALLGCCWRAQALC